MALRAWRYITIAMVGCVLIACTSGTPAEPLPTLAQLPTLAPVAATDAGAISAREALPPTWTPEPTSTETPTITPSPTITVTPSLTITPTPSPTNTRLPTIDPGERPLYGLIEEALQATVWPTDQLPTQDPTIIAGIPTSEGIRVISTSVGQPAFATPIPGNAIATPSTINCQYLPAGGFGTAFTNNPDVANQLGCPLGNPPDVLIKAAAHQRFEHGTMIWIEGDIYVLYDGTGQLTRYNDTYIAGTDPETSSETPPQGLTTPVRGILKIWSQNPAVRQGLGWAIGDEVGTQATVQNFINGLMVWLPIRSDILALVMNPSGRWQSISGQF